jgi:hypothetical protein
VKKDERPWLEGAKGAVGDTSRQVDPTAPTLPPPAPIDPLAFRKRTAARLLDISERTLERLAAAGKFPKPDAHAGKCPLWTRATLEAWVRQGGGRIS